MWLIVAILLGIGASLSLGIGVHHALENGTSDLQWSGSRLLWHHHDPWAQRLDHPPFTLSNFSPPNYLHLLYLLLLPIAFVPLPIAKMLWCGGSVLASIASTLLLVRFFGLTRAQGFAALALLWMSSPFRTVLEVGQLSLVELLLFCLVFTVRSVVPRGICFGISLVKYSFSPVLGFFLLRRKCYRVLLVAAGVSVAGLLGCFALLPTPLLRLAREPLLVARTAVNPGIADWMTVVEYGFRNTIGTGPAKALSYLIALGVSAAFAVRLSSLRLSRTAELSLLGMASLLFFKHLIYDYVFLMIPLCYAFSIKRTYRVTAPIFAGVAIFWFSGARVNRVTEGMRVHFGGLLVNCLLLTALLAYTLHVSRQTGMQIPPETGTGTP